jgi:protoheme IX farnesyltransferase
MNTDKLSLSSAIKQKIEDYKVLVKHRLNLLVVFSAALSYITTVKGSINWTEVAILSLAGFLVTGASNALNEVFEKDFDKQMKRTENRPLAAGRMTVSEAVLAAGLMSLLGLMLLATFNPMTVLLGVLSLVSYAFVYTPMKRVSPIAVMIGAIPGALPAMIGSVAVSGTMTTLAMSLFTIQFLWQFPHFWAIAWLADEDYKRAGFNLLPSSEGRLDSSVGWNSFMYAMFMIPASVAPYALGFTGIFSAIVLSVAAAFFAYYAFQLYQKCTNEAARSLMFCSFFYLPIAQIALALDKI